MDYYVVSGEDGRILEVYGHQPDPQKVADDFGEAIWIIVGEHSGLSARPSPTTPPPNTDAKTG